MSHKTGIYEGLVRSITEFVKPGLHKVSDEFIEKSVEENASDNPRYAKIIAFEVRRRGDGAGLTQDVAEPLLWTGIKTAAALGIAAFTHRMHSRKFRFVGDATALGIMLNNVVELLRLIPRYKAGLQGSLEMAKDRWESIEKTGVDPFESQTGDVPADAARNARWEAKLLAAKLEKDHSPKPHL